MDAEGQPTGKEPASGRLERGEAPRQLAEESCVPKALTEPDPKTMLLMEQAVQRDNLRKALKRVRANKGSPGVDGMTVDELVPHLREHWEELKKKLLDGSYEPCPVKRVEIQKPSGGIRMLGIPTVLDRFIQQAILQVLTPLFDPSFSEHSYGFRPGKSAHQAVETARKRAASVEARKAKEEKKAAAEAPAAPAAPEEPATAAKPALLETHPEPEMLPKPDAEPLAIEQQSTTEPIEMPAPETEEKTGEV